MTKLSQKYLPIPTEDMIQVASSALDAAGVDYDQRVRNLNSYNDVVTFTFKNDVSLFAGTDTIFPTIKLYCNHNGKAKQRIRVGFQRPVCSNGMTVSQNFFARNIKHLKCESTYKQLEELPEYITAAVAFIKNELIPLAQRLQRCELTTLQLTQVVDTLKIPKAVKLEATEQINGGRVRATYDMDNNLWSLFNLVNEAIRKSPRTTANSDERHNKNLMRDMVVAAEDILAA